MVVALCIDCRKTPRSGRHRLCRRCQYVRHGFYVPCDCGGVRKKESAQCRTCFLGGPAVCPPPLPPDQAAWLAGLIEGEGSFVRSTRRLRVQMTDEDVIRKAACIANVGTVTRQKARAAHHKVPFSWAVYRLPHITWVVEQTGGWYSGRRLAAALAVAPQSKLREPDATCVWAWFAGLYEGEGSVGVARKGGCWLEVSTTDQDVACRAAALIGAAIYTSSRAKESWKILYRVRISKRILLHRIAPEILPWLGERRSRDLRRVLTSRPLTST
jgi:hypothetical protein